MKTLLSLPPNLAARAHTLQELPEEGCFCTSDPQDRKLGSGGGTVWLLEECMRSEGADNLAQWLPRERRVLMHAGGQSRRLPAYAAMGKVFTPLPVFGRERGQKLGQTLLDLQLPLYRKILAMAPENTHTLVASGDVYIRAGKPLQPVPQADVVCYGLWSDLEEATRHGVFVMRRDRPQQLDYMLQKPGLEEIGEVSQRHICLMDIGIWLLSDKAVERLAKRAKRTDGQTDYYDLYGRFGLALGNRPRVADSELNELTVAIVPLPGGRFHHFGTSRELLSSATALHAGERDRLMRPAPSVFIQNAVCRCTPGPSNHNLWIENSCVPAGWTLEQDHIITGVPHNNWPLHLPQGICLDIVPVGREQYAVRPYGFDDPFRGGIHSPGTLYQNRPLAAWLQERGLTADRLEGDPHDLQDTRLFPIVRTVEEMGVLARWMTSEPQLDGGKALWEECPKASAGELPTMANMERLAAQRAGFMKANYEAMSRDYTRSAFYQLDLAHTARQFVRHDLPAPQPLPPGAPLMQRINNSMLCAHMAKLQGGNGDDCKERAHALLREGMLGELAGEKAIPRLHVCPDQIVWGRCPVRIDLAGGWTDTPPYSIYAGGSVVNMAIELNGQPPLQVYVKPSPRPHITLRSIDMGAAEVVETYEQLTDFKKIGSPFSIPKAALALAGFAPMLQGEVYPTLRQQLQDFGCGIEVTLLAAIPAGSGLGTSSILAAAVLGALNDFCGLQWSKNDIGRRTLVLEQLLTTGGGWQDQYGGVLHGVKLLETGAGMRQDPQVSWLPGDLFTNPAYSDLHLLYYTGMTRVAKNILGDIVGNMFLNSGPHLLLLNEMKEHAAHMATALQRGDFDTYGRLVGKTWQQNKQLDAGTNPPAVEHIIGLVSDYTSGLKLPGAGGGGYLYMVAKDREAARRIRETLTLHAPNNKARFVEMSLSSTGLQVSRS